MDILLWLLVLFAAGLYGIAIAGELAFPTASRAEMRALSRADAGGESGVEERSGAEALLDDPGRFLTTMLVLKTVALIMVGTAVALLLPEFTPLWQVAAAGIGAALVILVANATLRSAILGQPAAVAVRLTPLLLVTMRVLTPITFVLRAIGRRNRPREDELLPEDVLLSENGLRLLMGIRTEDGPILESEKEMIASILEMDDTAAREVMVPRMDMVAINVDLPLPDALDVIMDVGHSRIPVYEDNIDNIVGILYAKDLLRCYREGQNDANVRELLREPYFVPLSKKVNVLLHDMQKHRVHIAMVVDEYGGTAGLVTIEDILEEIVGDIQDEYDTEEDPYVEVIGEEVYLLNSRLDLYSLAKLLDTELSDEDADTLGGLIYSVLGHVPAQGEAVEIGGWRFTVQAIDGNRIDQVRADRITLPAVVDEERVSEEESARHGSTNGHHPVTVSAMPAAEPKEQNGL